MGGDRSAYALLGLSPGADRQAIEQAYRRLIKVHHPDRAGGDAGRAAEITRAYRELKAREGRGEALEFHAHPVIARIGPAWQVIALSLAVGLLSLAILAGGRFDSGFGARAGASRIEPVAKARDRVARATPLEQPIDLADIEVTVARVRNDFASLDEMEFAARSRTCHLEFRLDPEVRTFDRCAAFDYAVILLQDRDPLRDQGPFREVGVVRRHWSEGLKLSDDGWALDSRLDAIRLRVELMLAPTIEPQPAGRPAAL